MFQELLITPKIHENIVSYQPEQSKKTKSVKRENEVLKVRERYIIFETLQHMFDKNVADFKGVISLIHSSAFELQWYAVLWQTSAHDCKHLAQNRKQLGFRREKKMFPAPHDMKFFPIYF